MSYLIGLDAQNASWSVQLIPLSVDDKVNVVKVFMDDFWVIIGTDDIDAAFKTGRELIHQKCIDEAEK